MNKMVFAAVSSGAGRGLVFCLATGAALSDSVCEASAAVLGAESVGESRVSAKVGVLSVVPAMLIPSGQNDSAPKRSKAVSKSPASASRCLFMGGFHLDSTELSIHGNSVESFWINVTIFRGWA